MSDNSKIYCENSGNFIKNINYQKSPSFDRLWKNLIIQNENAYIVFK